MRSSRLYGHVFRPNKLTSGQNGSGLVQVWHTRADGIDYAGIDYRILSLSRSRPQYGARQLH
ncbi:hypothetical protein IJH02_02520 [Candidatus Saccharibacteria bacterium]|nr:hypothetical protein [Candidatus Saccharibacteria bacterium]